ncbi:hypothetical protein CHUAL_006692 [Chamberlinius hualienensis]
MSRNSPAIVFLLLSIAIGSVLPLSVNPRSYYYGFYYDSTYPNEPCGNYDINYNPCTNNVGAYYPVQNNPSYFVQCGSGGIPACKECPYRTVWSQNNLVCV